MELREQPQENEGEPVQLTGAPGVRVSGLTFAYEGQEKPVFEGLDFDFAPGTMTAIMGHTGAGKSTLIRVIMDLLHPSEGTVEIYDAEGAHPSTPDTRCNFQYVPQGNSLMSGTIRQNLLLADPEATEEKMREALETAVAEFVLELPLGLDTPCSEVGAGLSEGQAQRIAIASGRVIPQKAKRHQKSIRHLILTASDRRQGALIHAGQNRIHQSFCAQIDEIQLPDDINGVR